ncbi:MAG: ABC transporter permease [Candidatus Methanoperedens sp.]|nr:ABC transporter permease [Candidatus Methanoperedens sp.]MCZ7406719.1 ABC transporter permease [Candidatus Methanoperedens sp.]
MSGKRQSLRRTLRKFIALLVFLLLWELLPASGIISKTYFAPPSEVFAALVRLTISGELWIHTSISLERAVTGFGLAAIIMIPLGFLMGWYKGFEEVADGLVQTLRQTSSLSLFPVFILFLGIGEVSKIAVIFWGAQWPILLNTINGVKSVDPLLIKSARSMGSSASSLFRKVVIPSSLPSIITGLRLSATHSIIVLVAAEMIGAKSGLGYSVINWEYNFMIPEMYAAIVMLALLGLITNYSLVWLEKTTTKWKEEITIT